MQEPEFLVNFYSFQGFYSFQDVLHTAEVGIYTERLFLRSAAY